VESKNFCSANKVTLSGRKSKKFLDLFSTCVLCHVHGLTRPCE